MNNFTNKKVPYSAQIELTLRCNAKCPFCSFHTLPESILSYDMNTAQIKKLIDELANLGILALSFTGGEPTLRKDLPELIYHTGIVHSFMNGIASNGYLLPKLFRKSSLEGLDYILLSLDYPKAELHDRRRGIKTFNRVLDSINLANKNNIKPIISTVVMKDNIRYLKDMCELADSLNCSIELYPCEDIVRDFPDKTYRIDNITDLIPDISLWANLMRSLRRQYKNILTDPISIEVVEKGGFGGYPQYHQNLLRCHVAEAYLFISHDGFIHYPCKIHPITSFNALKHPMDKVYYSKEVRDIMNEHDNYRFCDRCRLGCAIASSIPTRWKALYSKYIRGYLDGNLR
ncbi:MAG: Antilisterial bacteriocin subtilosin biosynthesis protein AlbA [Candidatus Lokiarchaeum sp. GC14_75]|nr:MAG: Antilisterial bacteriocin subtilosin biosynthesis protein AlbA [Candidatus Lokiarchaeum sp. GC14_75]